MKVRNGHRIILPDAASQLLPGFPLTAVPGNIDLVFHFCAKENLLNRILQGFLVFFYPAGTSDDGLRVVFMVDLWHPNVAAAERQALDYIFTPARLEDKDGK